jgi:hypothetical protein
MSDKELSDAEYDERLHHEHINASDSDDRNDDESTEERSTLPPENSRNSYGEIRELQRLMLEVARTDEMGSARASAARAYRDLEILRCAKRGKPLCLSATATVQTRQASSPMISLTPVDQSNAA